MSIRSQVRMLGTLSGMQLPVDLFGERAADPVDLREVRDARAEHAAQAPEAREELPAALASDPGDALERRGDAALRAPRAGPGDREAVRFVAYFLYQVQSQVIRRQGERPARDPQLFESRLP